MTEAEAKEKWCPIICSGGWPGVGVSQHISEYHKCRAADCMMWRVCHKNIVKYESVVIANGFDRRSVESRPVYEMHGYCGLAGKPAEGG